MDWPAWRPTYEAILADFGYDRAADARARDLLDAFLAHAWQAELPDLSGREAIVLGPLPARVPPDGPLLMADPRAPPPRRPDLMVTDLDGDVALQAALNAMGVPLVVHAHGDNVPALQAHVPRFRGPLAGTCQCEPRGRVKNFGGFTDGDRAACLAAALGASSVRLVGFDWERAAEKPGRDAGVKQRKLAWARKIVSKLGVPVTTDAHV